MSKHHQNALILLGIAVCAGFLLSVPAAAGSGQGLAVLETGELLPISIREPPAAENGSEPSGDPVLPDENGTPDAVPVFTEDDADPDMPAVTPGEGNATGAIPAPTGADAGTEPTMPAGETGSYDDERLAGLVETTSIRLMRLSMEHAHALYLQDADAAATAADDLHAFSVRLLREVEPLQVSPERQPFKDEFVRSLEAYSLASSKLLGSTDPGEDAVPAAFSDLAAASENLETVSREAGEIQSRAPMVNVAAGAPGTPAGTGPVVMPPPQKVLHLLERHTYDDPGGENMVSVLAESTRTATAYREVPGNESTPTVEAGEGRMFLLVAVKSTNLGHKGDSDLYTIETPARDAFVLDYEGTTFAPLTVPPFTTLGESFDKKPLERYESLKGYLYFDVPETLEASGATLRADLGYAGTPTWRLDEVPDDAEAV
ncbi:hypothetical protein [Methanoculleus sp. MH98A]|uniref:hypothetical protein n=1 Tax=Methanoculleus sp. MH98A TaxID=1495314 RepID=UPI000A613892|nr:hypothetical protein [Methanoculleus sp. MH98A]